MTQQEKQNKVADFIAQVTQSLPYFLHNKIMDSFDVKFEYEGEQYQLALIKNGKVHGEEFELQLN